MRKQIKAEAYKLINSKRFYVSIGICGLFFLLFLVMSNGEGGFYMGQYVDFVNNVPVLNGFIGFIFEDPQNPTMWEIIYSGVVFSGMLWILLISIAVPFYLNEFKNGTIKLSVAYGGSKIKIFLSKLIVVNVYFGILFYVFFFSCVLYYANSVNYPITGELIWNAFKLLTLNYMIYVAISFMIYFICTLIKNTIVVSAIFILYIYSMIFILLATYNRKMSLLVYIYNHINPMYYLWNSSSFWARNYVVVEIIVYFIAAIVVYSIASFTLLKKQEIK